MRANMAHMPAATPTLEPLRPLFRWAGSKRKLLPHLLAAAPRDFARYVEPFAGSACLFFALQPTRAILGDTNEELIRTYAVVRNRPAALANEFFAIPKTRAEYYRQRSLTVSDLSPTRRAARFLYLNRHCFNGVYRVNRAGDFNVPMGTKTGVPPSVAEFRACATALRRAELVAGDFEKCLARCRKGDFVYLDPPYTAVTRKTYGEYGYGCFSNDDLPRLVAALERVHSVGATFVLSYSPLRLIGPLPRRWHVQTVRVRRHVAGFASARRQVQEVLVSNRPLILPRGGNA